MSESKSKIISFRLSSQLERLASVAAGAAGDKNASAWCQRLAIEALSRISDSNQSETAERSPESAAAKNALNALSNIRQLNLDCYKLLIKNDEQYKEFLNIVIASEEEWEMINRSVSNSKIGFSPAANEPTVVAKENLTAKSKILGKATESSESQSAAGAISNEYLLFAEEMKNEIAGLIGEEEELPVFQNG